MAAIPAQEGQIPFAVASIDTPCFTSYRLFGDLKCGSPAVIVIHGGPGAGHEYLLPFAELWPRYGLPVILYDQLGCAASTHLPDTAGDKSFWNEALFVDELKNLIKHFNLQDGAGFHLLGQSWGGNLSAVFAAQRPVGLRCLVLASAVASKDLGLQGLRLLRKQLPLETQQTLDHWEEKGEFDRPEYMAAIGQFYKKHLCRVENFPPRGLGPTLKHLSEDKTVYGTMNGPSPLKTTGSLLGWTCIPRLSQITAPTLVYNGEFDTSHDIGTVPFFENIPRVRWITFAEGGHMCHLEPGLREKIFKIVGDFLTQNG